MKKQFFYLLLLLLAFSATAVAKAPQKAAAATASADSLRVTIFGDSYSTFYGWLTPATNESWYFPAGHPGHVEGNDVTRVEETWWYQVIQQMGYKLEMNNSYSGSTVGYYG